MAGQTEKARQTGSLLANLVEQRRHVHDAARLLDDVAALAPRVEGAEAELARTETTIAALATTQARIGTAARETAQASRVLGQVEQIVRNLVESDELSCHASAAWDAMADLRTAVLAHEDQTPRAAKSLADVQRVQQKLAAEAPRLATAQQALNELAALRRDVFNTACKSHAARTALAGVERVFGQLAQLGDATQSSQAVVGDWMVIQEQLAESGPLVERTARIVCDLLDMAHSTVDQTQTVDRAWEVHEAASQLTAAVLAQGELTQRAAGAFAELADVQLRLVESTRNQVMAERALGDALQLQDTLLGEADHFAQAVRTLEAWVDLNDQFAEMAGLIEDLRRSTNEVILLRPAIERAFQTIRPLLELTDLRRVTPEDIKRMVSAMSRQRDAGSPRVAQNPE